MFCHSCGKQLPDTAKFCTGCGALQIAPEEDKKTPIPPQPPAAPQPPQIPPEPAQFISPPAAHATETIDASRAFTYLFNDQQWLTRVIIGGLVLLLTPLFGIGIFIVYGYIMQVIKNVAEGNELPLPEWDIGKYLGKGFVVFICTILLSVIIFVPIALIALVFRHIPGLAVLAIALRYVAQFVFTLYFPIAFAAVSVEENYGAMFQFQRIISMILNNIVPYILVIIFSIGAGIIGMFGLIGFIICVIFTIIIAQLMVAHLLGQFYRIAHK
ncbi:MAG: DUF4013 domain-containing protein [bacterium]